jgi:hypothetical protein
MTCISEAGQRRNLNAYPTMSEQPPPEHSTARDPASTGSQPAREKASFRDYLRGAPAPVHSVVRQALKGAPWVSSETEFEDMARLLKAHGAPVQRLGAVLCELTDEQSAFARHVTRLAETYVRAQLPATMPWLPIAPAVTKSDLKNMLRALVFAPVGDEVRARNQHAACFVLWVARLRGVIGGDVLAELASFAFPPPQERKEKTGVVLPPDLSDILFPLLHKKSARDSVLATVEYYGVKLRAAADEAHALESEVARLKLQLAEQQTSQEKVQSQLAVTVDDFAAKDRRIAALERDIADHKAVARQAASGLRARLNGRLQGDLLPLVRDMHDAATMEPVRTHIILDRAETARKLIEKETQWLESSD